MFGKMQDMMKQMQTMQKLMKDENFKAFITHPKVQELLRDPEFQTLIKGQDMSKIMTHPKFTVFREDPELAAMALKFNLKDLQA